MDENRKKEIEAAWRKFSREQFFQDLKRIKLGLMMLVVAIVALVGFVSFVYSVPPSLVETIQGRVVGQFADPSRLHSERWRVTVQLDDGRTVSFQMPRSEPLDTEASMKVGRYRRVIGPLTYDSYRFVGYADDEK